MVCFSELILRSCYIYRFEYQKNIRLIFLILPRLFPCRMANNDILTGREGYVFEIPYSSFFNLQQRL